MAGRALMALICHLGRDSCSTIAIKSGTRRASVSQADRRKIEEPLSLVHLCAKAEPWLLRFDISGLIRGPWRRSHMLHSNEPTALTRAVSLARSVISRPPGPSRDVFVVFRICINTLFAIGAYPSNAVADGRLGTPIVDYSAQVRIVAFEKGGTSHGIVVACVGLSATRRAALRLDKDHMAVQAVPSCKDVPIGSEPVDAEWVVSNGPIPTFTNSFYLGAVSPTSHCYSAYQTRYLLYKGTGKPESFYLFSRLRSARTWDLASDCPPGDRAGRARLTIADLPILQYLPVGQDAILIASADTSYENSLTLLVRDAKKPFTNGSTFLVPAFMLPSDFADQKTTDQVREVLSVIKSISRKGNISGKSSAFTIRSSSTGSLSGAHK